MKYLFLFLPFLAPLTAHAEPYQLVGPVVDGEAAVFTAWAAKQKGTLDVIIHSNGGDVNEAMAIATVVRSRPSRCEVRGGAGSAAFFILQNCGKRVMTSTSRLATHEPYASTNAPLTRRIALHIASVLEPLTNLWEIVLSNRLGMPRDAYRAKVQDGAWVMTSDEAIDAYAIDVVIPPETP